MWSRIPTAEGETDSAPPRRRLWRRVRGAISTLFALALIAWIATQAISRTAGFRKLIADYVSGRWAIAAEIGRSAWQWNGALEVGAVRIGEAANPAFRARRLRLDFDWPWRPARLRGVLIEDAELQLIRTREGEWQPRMLADFAVQIDRWFRQALPGLPPSARDTPRSEMGAEPARERAERAGAFPWPRFSAHRCRLSWRDADGSLHAHVEGLDLEAAAIRLQGRSIVHVRFAADHIRGLRGEELSAIRAEMVLVDGHCLPLDLSMGSAAP